MNIGYFNGKHKMNNVVTFLDSVAQKNPNKIAFVYKNEKGGNTTNESIDYVTFNESSARLATGLNSTGIKKGDRVIVFLPLSTHLYQSIAAIQRIGAIPVFIDSWARQEQLIEILKNASPNAIISVSQIFDIAQELLQQFSINIQISLDPTAQENIISYEKLFKNDPQGIEPVKQEDTALITYTTGSSGVPKGVNRTHRFLAAQHYALKRLFPYKKNDIDLPVFPVFALNNIASGITSVLPDIDISKPKPNDAAILLDQVTSCGVTCMTLAPSSFRMIASHCKKNNITIHLRRVLTGGAPISEIDISEFVSISPESENWILYGSTEVEPIAYIESKEMLQGNTEKLSGNITERGVLVGEKDPKLNVALINTHETPIQKGVTIESISVEQGSVGELIVSGENVCKDYYNNNEAFNRVKIIDSQGIIWHRTGDMARIDSKKNIWIVGRLHNTIKYKDTYYFPVVPEILLKDITGIENAAYVSSQTKIFAVIEIGEEIKKSTEDLENVKKNIKLNFNKKNIPIDEIIIIDAIPMDVRHHSKVDYPKLKELL